jgi:hypothetical protein
MGAEPIVKPPSIKVDEHKGEKGLLTRMQFFPDQTGRRLYGPAFASE